MLDSCYTRLLILAEGGHEPDPLKFDADLALFTLVIFLGLLFVLGKFAWKPLIQGLNTREENIANQIESAERANENAQANLRQYEERLALATDEAKAVLDEAKKDAVAVKDRILGEAQEEAQRIRDRALADIEAAKNAAVRDLAEKSVDSAVSLAGSIVGRSLDKQDHDKLIEDSISSFTDGA
ncbi:MAG: F0F1 ATP synthase subunit B [Mariniblastus sp.]|nr:F0F1 ATP synthase subunit B [Mariniblastus sp.]